MNHAGEIAPLARLARPHVALITAIDAAHLGHLGSIEAIADEKAALAAGLEPGGVAVLPADTEHCRCCAHVRAAPASCFGRRRRGRRAAAARARSDAEGSRCHGAMSASRTAAFRLAAPGRAHGA